MLINTVEGRECRIAIVSDAGLEELYVERDSSASHVGNIYKGKITNVESAIQAAFVDFGLTKNGFLHISDVHPQYFPKGSKSTEAVGRKRSYRHRPPLQECLRRGQEVVVQMTKEGIGTKGPTMTTYLSIPGRLLVMMPGMSRLGVSRKVEDEQLRIKARTALNQLKLPPDMGFIVRTAGLDRSKRDLQRDLNYLLRLWKSVDEHIKSSKAPAEIYQESDLVTRTLRDVYTPDIDRIICDTQAVADKAQEFLSVALPRTKNQIQLYAGKEGLFQDFGLESEIEKIYSRRVQLPGGGSLVIDQAEALVAIDVNSGRFREHSDAETTATKLNIEAAKEIARQLRLRDLGGVVIIDFVDMREERNRRAVEKAFKNAISVDRAKTKLLRISPLGMLEMTRQRVRADLKTNIYRTCDHCDGTGLIKSEESQALQVMRQLQRSTSSDDVAQIEIRVTNSVAHYLNNHHRRQIAQMEADLGAAIVVRADAELAGDEIHIVCKNTRGSTIAWRAEHDDAKGKSKKVKAVPLDDVGATQNDRKDEEQAEPTEQAKAMAKEGEPPEPDQPPAAKKSRRRGRRGRNKHKKHTTTTPEDKTTPQEPASAEKPDGKNAAQPPSAEQPAGKNAAQPPSAEQPDGKNAAQPPSAEQPDEKSAKTPADQPSEPGMDKPKRRRRRSRRKSKKARTDSTAADSQ